MPKPPRTVGQKFVHGIKKVLGKAFPDIYGKSIKDPGKRLAFLRDRLTLSSGSEEARIRLEIKKLQARNPHLK